ncbi:MAG: hypothetical protein KGD64_11815 [Candidatus Heimdallarchaeota archaeon]|nr:hypothetical protein [Candidatus Heimdallarchaeota archaeon]
MDKPITLCIFLHGTIIMHSSGQNVSREERVLQVRNNDSSIHNYSSYIPIGNAVDKLHIWKKQGVKIIYLSFHRNKIDIQKDNFVLRKFGFPKGKIVYRKKGQEHKELIESIKPDILIEDENGNLIKIQNKKIKEDENDN